MNYLRFFLTLHCLLLITTFYASSPLSTIQVSSPSSELLLTHDATSADEFASESSKRACAICLEDLTSPKKELPCAHEFHAVCYQELKKSKPESEQIKCPLCRAGTGEQGENKEAAQEIGVGQPQPAFDVIEAERLRRRTLLKWVCAGIIVVGSTVAFTLLNAQYGWIHFDPHGIP